MYTPSTTVYHVRQLVTATSTIFVNPSSVGSVDHTGSSVPIAAIAGGACGGVVLAVLAVIGWKWWGLQIKKQQQRELERRRAMASRRGRSSRSISESRRTSSDSSSRLTTAGIQNPAITPLSDSVPPVPPLPPLDKISPPRPLKPRSGASASEKDWRPILTPPRSTVPSNGRSRMPSLDGRSHRPLRPSPLAAGSPSSPAHSPRATDLSIQRQRSEKATEPSAASTGPPSSFARIPRIKASLSSLTGEARRQSKASSHNSASDQSRYSGAGGSSRRWSWWSLINGRGFRQVGVGTGKNRISAETSIYEDWQEEDPSVPIGYAFSGVDDNVNGREPGEKPTNQSGDTFISSSKLERGA